MIAYDSLDVTIEVRITEQVKTQDKEHNKTLHPNMSYLKDETRTRCQTRSIEFGYDS